VAIEDQLDFEVDLLPMNDGVLVAMSGEVDIVVPYLQLSLVQALENSPRNLRIDLSEVSFLDSTAIGLLVSTKKRLSACGGSFSVECGHSHVRRVVEIMGLGDYLNVDSAGLTAALA
jgi:anti-sigma B factor antagonist